MIINTNNIVDFFLLHHYVPIIAVCYNNSSSNSMEVLYNITIYFTNKYVLYLIEFKTAHNY